MTSETVSTTIGAENVPDTIRHLSAMAQVDYADLYTAATANARDKSAENWARAALEETPLGRRARQLWRILGLRLGPPDSSDYVQGWEIAEWADDWIRVETRSWWATAHAVCQVDDAHVSLALFLRYQVPVAAVIWAPVSVMHQRAVPVLLHQALKHHHRRHPRDAGVGPSVNAAPIHDIRTHRLQRSRSAEEA